MVGGGVIRSGSGVTGTGLQPEMTANKNKAVNIMDGMRRKFMDNIRVFYLICEFVDCIIISS